MKHILYLDANNLYGWCFLQKLPIDGFQYRKDLSMKDLKNIPDDSPIGYFVEVDLEIPSKLKNYFSDFPPAPDHRKMDDNSIKLCATLEPKYNYLVHYRTLKLYRELGLKVTKLHSIIQFNQNYIYKNYVEFCSHQRQIKPTSEKDVWKLLVNSLYGKTIQDNSKFNNFELINSEERYIKLNNKRAVIRGEKIFNEDLAGINKIKKEYESRVPLQIGFAILELAKMHMYDTYYNKIKKLWSNVQLLFTDTDSVCFEVETDEDIYDILSKQDWIDFSNFPKTSKYYNDKNKLVPGKFKDEMQGEKILEFIGIRSKCYSILTEKQSFQLHKGIKKKTKISHETYKKVLFEENQLKVNQKGFRTKEFSINTENCEKIALDCKDNKRIITKNKIETLPYGYQ